MAKKSKIPKIDPYVEGFLSKLLDRLTSLEKKMDAVLSRMGKAAASQGQPPIQVPQQPKRDRQMYEAICADCAKVCEVPFQPSESRPVYCKQCWAKRKGHQPIGMPTLRPVSVPPKSASKLSAQAHMAQASEEPPKKTKKSKPKKTKKKK